MENKTMSEYKSSISNINLSYNEEENLICITLQNQHGQDISITKLSIDVSEKLYKGIKELLDGIRMKEK